MSFPIKHGGSFHSYVTVYQRVIHSSISYPLNPLTPLGLATLSAVGIATFRNLPDQSPLTSLGIFRVLSHENPDFAGEQTQQIMNCLVGLIVLTNMSSSDSIIIPTIGENKSHVPNHQPVNDIAVFGGSHPISLVKSTSTPKFLVGLKRQCWGTGDTKPVGP